jgi:hypothetical protein
MPEPLLLLLVEDGEPLELVDAAVLPLPPVPSDPSPHPNAAQTTAASPTVTAL